MNQLTPDDQYSIDLVSFLKKTINLTETLIKHFDDFTLPSTISILSMATSIFKNKDLFNAETLLGSCSFHTYIAMSKTIIKNQQLGKVEAMRALLNDREQIIKKCQDSPGNMDAEFYFDILHYTLNTKLPIDHFCSKKQLEQTLTSYAQQNSIIEQCFNHYWNIAGQQLPLLNSFYLQIRSEHLAEMLMIILQEIQTLPVKIQDVIPFFNPKSIEVSRNTTGIWKYALDYFMPEEYKFQFEHVPLQQDGIEQYQYQYKDDYQLVDMNFQREYKYEWKNNAADFIYALLKEYQLRHPAVMIKNPSLQHQLEIHDIKLNIMKKFIQLRVTEMNDAYIEYLTHYWIVRNNQEHTMDNLSVAGRHLFIQKQNNSLKKIMEVETLFHSQKALRKLRCELMKEKPFHDHGINSDDMNYIILENAVAPIHHRSKLNEALSIK